MLPNKPTMLYRRVNQQRGGKHCRPCFHFRPITRGFEQLEDRRLLASASWIGGTTGYWDVPSNWSGNTVPASTTDVTINPASPATVTIQAGDAESVNSVTVGAGDTLSITGGSLTTAAGVTNSGTITVDAGCNLNVGGSYTGNTGATLSPLNGGDPSFPTANLLANPGFESPVSGNWTLYRTPTPSLTTVCAHTGSQSLAVMGGTNCGAAVGAQGSAIRRCPRNPPGFFPD
jgi:hypothetical protein